MKTSYLSALAFISTALGQVVLHPNSPTTPTIAASKCLEVRGDGRANGTPVQMYVNCTHYPESVRWPLLVTLVSTAMVHPRRSGIWPWDPPQFGSTAPTSALMQAQVHSLSMASLTLVLITSQTRSMGLLWRFGSVSLASRLNHGSPLQMAASPSKTKVCQYIYTINWGVNHCPGLCLDLTNGNLANTNVVQVWECVTGNTNQIWTRG